MTPTELIEDISHDHAEISEAVESLRALLDAGDYGEARSLLVRLEQIEIRHYATEEALMRAVAYDRADVHRAEHAEMLDTLARINQTLALEPAASISPRILAHLEAALAHMIQADQKLGRFVAERAAKS
ncbi:MAG TPA: hemerythrin domain-containing protein [Burkholderiales bacterium]|nr:hemerythrin domain-containing protein [Burkholderiales bacterium]